MTDTDTRTAAANVLAQMLSEERTPEERIASIRDLHDSLADAATVRVLCEAARREKSAQVRRALLSALLAVDVTRLPDRQPLLELLLHVCASEPEEELRVWATRALAVLAPDLPQLEEVLAETLLHERSDAVHEAALVGLLRRPDKSERTLQLLLAYARGCPPIARGPLLQLFRQLPRAAAEAGLLALLSPWEDEPVREAVLAALEELPALSPAAGRALLAHLRAEPSRALRARTARLLGELRSGGDELASAVLAQLAAAPDGAELLDALSRKLDAVPELAALLGALLQRPAPIALKQKAIALLERASAHGPIAAALADGNPWVRAAAVEACARLFAKAPDELGRALCEAAAREELTEPRARIASALAAAGRLPAAAQRALVEWAAREQAPEVLDVLLRALPSVALTDQTRAPLLSAYLSALRDPFAGEAAAKAAGERLRSFAFRDEPLLIQCLGELLLRAPDREAAEEWFEQLRKLSPDPKDRAGVLRTLLLRYLGDYPAEPTWTWAKELHSLAPQDAAVRARIPQLVALTGETWMLSAADAAEKKSALLPVVLELLDQGKPDDAQRRIDEAWSQRTLRKSDLIALLRRLLADAPGEDAVLQTVVQILAKAKVATPEVQDLCLSFLRAHPRSTMTSTVAGFLKDVAKAELGYGERVVAAFTQQAYAEHCRTGGDPFDQKQVPRTINDWEYQGWRVTYPDWPLAELFFDLGQRGELHALLQSAPPPGVPALQSLQALVLRWLWQHAEESEAELRALAAQARAASGPLHTPLRDRALLLAWKRWKGYVRALQGAAPPSDLAELAADVFLHLCELRASFGAQSKEKQPEPLPEMDVARVQTRWTLGEAAWRELQEKALAAAAEARAKELLQLATSLSNKGKRAEAVLVLERLLGPFAGTKLVQQKRAEIEAYRDKARA